jgi:hypothetical protein
MVYFNLPLGSVTDGSFIVKARTPEKAIMKFLRNRKAKGEHPALWIDESKIIVRYPFCRDINRNKDGRFICGPQVCDHGGGTRGMCVLEHGVPYPTAGYCPISKMEIDPTKVEKIKVGGKEYLFFDANKK